ncbi:hypothetical protein EDD17DRAFT_1093526 [Pisolithus thermaeus]|nr:hypothetical protein EDD17DRAFT_1093526 [Pisolithus thermaeus]
MMIIALVCSVLLDVVTRTCQLLLIFSAQRQISKNFIWHEDEARRQMLQMNSSADSIRAGLGERILTYKERKTPHGGRERRLYDCTFTERTTRASISGSTYFGSRVPCLSTDCIPRKSNLKRCPRHLPKARSSWRTLCTSANKGTAKRKLNGLRGKRGGT